MFFVTKIIETCINDVRLCKEKLYYLIACLFSPTTAKDNKVVVLNYTNFLQKFYYHNDPSRTSINVDLVVSLYFNHNDFTMIRWLINQIIFYWLKFFFFFLKEPVKGLKRHMIF
jgi:hypothetical protein